jgi:hypothetical protein
VDCLPQLRPFYQTVGFAVIYLRWKRPWRPTRTVVNLEWGGTARDKSQPMGMLGFGCRWRAAEEHWEEQLKSESRSREEVRFAI